MKLSLAWIFDHIKEDYSDVSIKDLICKFNQTTAEIEGYKELKLDLEKFTLVSIDAHQDNNNQVKAYSKELNQEIILPSRSDIKSNAFYIAYYNSKSKSYSWATLRDLGSDKEGLLRQVSCPEELQSGQWKQQILTHDYIIEIDNKSLTNRPDLWGHRGIAREIAALLGKKLRTEDEFLASYPLHKTNKYTLKESNLSITLENSTEKNELICDRFAGLIIPSIENKATPIKLAFQLAKVDAKPINAIVDATNYVMLDIGQPMHAFDKNTIEHNGEVNITVRKAGKDEQITLLDGEEVTLLDTDIIVANDQRPLALAGVMGGLSSSITSSTQSIFIEAAHFNASLIRSTAARLKKRTDASVRFEKNIDPNNNVTALLRFLALLDNYSIVYAKENTILSVGAPMEPLAINIAHSVIEKKIGIKLDDHSIIKVLRSLDFDVKESHDQDDISYNVIVPTFRATKDVAIEEDIIEEIARLVGYDKVPFKVPQRFMKPFSIKRIQATRKIKNYLAFGALMHEAPNYAFFDESFLAQIKWEPHEALTVLSPVSENWRRLVTSLVPHLLKNIVINYTKSQSLRFFECARIWNSHKNLFKANSNQQDLNNSELNFKEDEQLAGIMFNKKTINFYDCKESLTTLFDLLKLEVRWEKVKDSTSISPWYHPYQTAYIIYNNKIIGMAGKSSPAFLAQADIIGDAFVFELNFDALVNTPSLNTIFKQLPKYQEVVLDISVMVPLCVTVESMESLINQSDSRISHVELLDQYFDSAWIDKKSLTFSFTLSDPHKTLTKEEIDFIFKSVTDTLESHGGHVR